MNRIPATAGLALLLAAALNGAAAEEGEVLPPWALSFRHGPLDVITIPYRDGSSRTYYYMTFDVENASKADAALALHLKVVTTVGGRNARTHFALPAADVEESVRRIARAPDLKNVQEINKHASGVLKPGEKLRGVAVFGIFDREWDRAVITVSGLEPRGIHCRVRKFGDGFTMFHRAYRAHNAAVMQAASQEDKGTDAYAIVQHDVLWRMTYLREGDEFEPHLDFAGRVHLDSEEWIVSEDPAPRIALEKQPPFGKSS